MELRRHLAVLRASFWLLMLSLVVATASAIALSSVLPKTYTGETTLIAGQALQSQNPDLGALQSAQLLSRTYAAVAMTDRILDAAAAKLGLGPDDHLRDRVSVSAQRDTSLLSIVATDRTPEGAAAIANEIAAQLIAASPAIQGEQSDIQRFIAEDIRAIRTEIAATQAEIDALLALEVLTPDQADRLDVLHARNETLRSTFATLLQVSQGAATNLLSIVDPAQPPQFASSPRIALNVAVAAIVGLLVGIALAYVRDYLDDRLRTPEDVAAVSTLVWLASIPKLPTSTGRPAMYFLQTLLYPRSLAAEQFRTLRTNIEFTSVDTPLRTVLVTSAVAREGKSIVSANLAVAFAQAGRRVCLVDADLRRPLVAEMFRVPQEPGLTDVLRAATFDFQAATRETEQPNLRLLTTGPLPPNPAELLGSAKMERVVEWLLEHVELVIFDSPPAQAVTDAALLAAIVDGTVMVVDASRTRRIAVLHALQSLNRVGARVLGVTLNQVKARAGELEGYYGDYAPTETPAPTIQATEPQAQSRPLPDNPPA